MLRKQSESYQSRRFPEGFLWGVSTAAHQIEGHQHNNWNQWEPEVADSLADSAHDRLGGVVPRWELIKDEATNPDDYVSGDAVDHYQRFREDIDIACDLNLNAYRFSVEWSRIEPEPGRFDQEALDHYEAIVDSLLERGIEPFLVLHHFTDPVWLEEAGGWHNPKTPELFARFIEVVTERLGDKVRYWITVNEANTYIFMRYLKGDIWPAWPNAEFSIARALKAWRYFAKAHRYAREKIQAANSEAQVGFVHTAVLFRGSGFASNRVATLARYLANTFMARPVKGQCDFIPLHYYSRWRISPGLSSPKNWIGPGDTEKLNDAGWSIEPEGIYEAVRMYQDQAVPIYIDENGIIDARDAYRSEFITRTVQALHRCIQDGADVRGYFHWSLLDNFEWSEGFWPKMGLVEVDRETQGRRIRPSAYTYQRIAGANGLVHED